MTDGHGTNYRYVSRKRRTKEDRRFITGRGKFVADVAIPGVKHVAVVTSPHPRANIRSIDTAAALEKAYNLKCIGLQSTLKARIKVLYTLLMETLMVTKALDTVT